MNDQEATPQDSEPHDCNALNGTGVMRVGDAVQAGEVKPRDTHLNANENLMEV